jgi:hypothetical protein
MGLTNLHSLTEYLNRTSTLAINRIPADKLELLKNPQLAIIRFRNPHSIAIAMDKLLRKKKPRILTYSHKGMIVKDQIIGD